MESVTLAILGGTLFSGAYLAENVRGGLQAIEKGQYEAARAMGLSTLQLTVFIVLPQALRAVIPALVGQTIAIFKDTCESKILICDFLHYFIQSCSFFNKTGSRSASASRSSWVPK